MSSDSWWVFLDRSMWCREKRRAGGFSFFLVLLMSLMPTLNWMKLQAQRFDATIWGKWACGGRQELTDSFLNIYPVGRMDRKADRTKGTKSGMRAAFGCQDEHLLTFLVGENCSGENGGLWSPPRRHTLEWLAECEAGISQQLLPEHLQYSQILSAPPAKLALAVEYLIWRLSGMRVCAGSKRRTEAPCMLPHGHDPRLSAASLDSIHISQANSRSHPSRSFQLHSE